MKSIYSLSLDQLTDEMIKLNQTPYRAKQIYSWIYKKGITSFDDMSDISKSFREELKNTYDFSLPKMENIQVSKDGTVKCLIRLSDNELVESVLMHYVYGYSVCISTEVGCSMGCKFCASGLIKVKRKLLANEMLGQVLAFNKYLFELNGSRISHVVLMGTGEPFDNYDSVLSFVKTINSPYGLEIGARHITISTCGIVPRIYDFAKEHLQVNLALSLHAPTNNIRNMLMPINRSYPLEDIIPAIIYFQKEAGRVVTFEYIMIKGVNDSIECAKELVAICKKTKSYVNLIPYNQVIENGLTRSSSDTVNSFHKFLLSNHIKSTIRKEFGSDINAACGQLRVKKDNEKS